MLDFLSASLHPSVIFIFIYPCLAYAIVLPRVSAHVNISFDIFSFFLYITVFHLLFYAISTSFLSSLTFYNLYLVSNGLFLQIMLYFKQLDYTRQI